MRKKNGIISRVTSTDQNLLVQLFLSLKRPKHSQKEEIVWCSYLTVLDLWGNASPFSRIRTGLRSFALSNMQQRNCRREYNASILLPKYYSLFYKRRGVSFKVLVAFIISCFRSLQTILVGTFLHPSGWSLKRNGRLIKFGARKR